MKSRRWDAVASEGRVSDWRSRRSVAAIPRYASSGFASPATTRSGTLLRIRAPAMCRGIVWSGESMIENSGRSRERLQDRRRSRLHTQKAPIIARRPRRLRTRSSRPRKAADQGHASPAGRPMAEQVAF